MIPLYNKSLGVYLQCDRLLFINEKVFNKYTHIQLTCAIEQIFQYLFFQLTGGRSSFYITAILMIFETKI